MARMVPELLPSTVLENPFRSTEIRVFGTLGDQLDASWTVYYSRPWLGLTAKGAEKEGEADFVVAHPDWGVLVIEVKGGRISRDGTTGRWTSTDRNDVSYNIRNPVEQANNSKHELRNRLRAHPQLRGHNLRLAHGVILPDVRGPGQDLGIDMPERLFAFAEDMGRLAAWVAERLRAVNPEPVSPKLGAEGMLVLEELLARSFTLHASLKAALEADDRRIDALTEEQYQLLEQVASIPQARIAGGAGTGKTLLALEKAHRLAEEGKRVLLACVSSPLASHLASLCTGVPGITCVALSSLPEEPGGSGSPRRRVSSAGLLGFLSQEDAYDAVILDEGQDVDADVIAALDLALAASHDGVFYVFYDDCQRIAGALTATAGIGVPLRLPRNLRNTKQIMAAARPYFRRPITSAGPDGVPVEWIELAGSGKWITTIESRVGRLLGIEKMAARDIAILTGSEPARDTLRELPSLRAHIRASVERSGLAIETVTDFKGLERRIVILCDLESILNNPEALYVALTRARVHLVVVGTRGQLATVDFAGTRLGPS